MAALRAMLRVFALWLIGWLAKFDARDDEAGRPVVGERRGRKSDPKVIAFSDQFFLRHGRSPSGSEIRAAFPELPTSTAYDYAGRARLRA